MKYFLSFMIACMAFTMPVQAASPKESLLISGSTYKGDTVKIYLWDHYFGDRKRNILRHREMQQICDSGNYTFRFDSIKGPVYFSLDAWSGRKNYSLTLYRAMPGDSICIRQNGYRYFTFSGKGSEAIRCRYDMDSVFVKVNSFFNKKNGNIFRLLEQKKYLRYLELSYPQVDSVAKAKKIILEGYRQSLTRQQYQILQADIIGRYILAKSAEYNYALSSIPKKMAVDSVAGFKRELYRYFITEIQIPETGIPAAALCFSESYVHAKSLLAFIEATMHPGKPGYQLIMDRYQGTLRDQLLTTFLFEHADSGDSIMRSVLKSIRTPYCREPMQFFLSAYSQGITAYDFALKDAAGKIRKLSEFRGKRVVLDYWFTGCSGCIILYTGILAEVEKRYARDSSVVFISIARDADKATWMESLKSGKYTSMSAINLFTGSATDEHPAIRNYAVSAYPTLVIIDEKGRISKSGFHPSTQDELIVLLNRK